MRIDKYGKKQTCDPAHDFVRGFLTLLYVGKMLSRKTLLEVISRMLFLSCFASVHLPMSHVVEVGDTKGQKAVACAVLNTHI